MKHVIIATAAMLIVAGPALAGGNGNAVNHDNNHGQVAKTYAQAPDGNGVGDAIGGLGKSDGDKTNGQVNSPLGRGGEVQNFLGGNFNIGSEKAE